MHNWIQPISKDLLSKYRNDYFIESGSGYGDSITIALDTGFKFIRSVELDRSRYKLCQDRFHKNSNVTLYNGDSSKMFSDLISDLREPATIWLDAHYCNINIDTMGNNFPLLFEIDQIVATGTRHVVLIDDTTLLPGFKTPPEQIVKRLDRLGGYVYRLEDSGRVLVCNPEKT